MFHTTAFLSFKIEKGGQSFQSVRIICWDWYNNGTQKKSRKAPEEPTDPEIDVQYLKNESESDSDDSSSSEVIW